VISFLAVALLQLYVRQTAAAEIMLDARVRQMLNEQIARYTEDRERGAMFRYRTGELTPGENRIKNPGFESVRIKEKYPPPGMVDKLDWENAGVYGWAFYPPASKGTGRFGISQNEKHSGKSSGSLKGTGSGLYITVVREVKPGDLYHVQAYVKNTVHATREDKPSVTLSVFWLGDKDNWNRYELRTSVDTVEVDRWVPLELFTQIPQNAATAVILIGAKPLMDDETVFIDDVSFRILHIKPFFRNRK